MNKEILVDTSGFSTRVAVVENGAPVELYVEQEGSQRLVGNIYNGKVQNVLPGMQAAFVDIGLERNAFLYAGDIVLSDDPDDEIERVPDSRNIRDILKPGQTIMVQVAKDPVGTKGARVTTHITLAGRTLVLMPTMDYVGVSGGSTRTTNASAFARSFRKSSRRAWALSCGRPRRANPKRCSRRTLKASSSCIMKSRKRRRRKSARAAACGAVAALPHRARPSDEGYRPRVRQRHGGVR
jgi:hypothetical protein